MLANLSMAEIFVLGARSRPWAPRSWMITAVIIIVHTFIGASFGGTALLPLDVTIWKTQHHVGDCEMKVRGLDGLETDCCLL